MMKRILIYVFMMLGLLAIVGVAATYGTGFAIPWWTVDGGGGTSSGGGYILSGTAGQPDAGQTNGGDYTVSSGLWPGSEPPPPHFRFYLPIIMSQTANTSSSGFR